MNLVFASGFLFPQKIIGENYFRDLPRKFPDTLFPNVPVAGVVKERARELAKQISKLFPTARCTSSRTAWEVWMHDTCYRKIC
jgi:hypothetical protein